MKPHLWVSSFISSPYDVFKEEMKQSQGELRILFSNVLKSWNDYIWNAHYVIEWVVIKHQVPTNWHRLNLIIDKITFWYNSISLELPTKICLIKSSKWAPSALCPTIAISVQYIIWCSNIPHCNDMVLWSNSFFMFHLHFCSICIGIFVLYIEFSLYKTIV